MLISFGFYIYLNLHVQNPITQHIQIPNKNITVSIRREDLLHSFISGNKFRKLKYNIQHCIDNHYDTLVTFGGAYSNHIAATAYACKINNLNCVGIIRGEDVLAEIQNNPTLQLAQKNGMKFEFVSRDEYRSKNEEAFLEKIKSKYGNCYIVPEGGTNDFAIKGCEEILQHDDNQYDFICCAVGTGGTVSGIINSSHENQKVLGFPALKGDFLQDEIRNFAKNSNCKLITDYHFGGYAKINEELVTFLNEFYETYKIPLDPIYTGKMVFGIFDLIHKNYFPENAKILIIHTGGLQGIHGMNQYLQKKKMNTIIYNE